MTGDALADEHVERAVPASEDPLQVGTVLAARTSDGQRTEAAFHTLAHPVNEDMTLTDADAERSSEIRSGKAAANRWVSSRTSSSRAVEAGGGPRSDTASTS